MTGLSNAEERLNPLAWKAQWLLEDRLKEAGADYTAGLPLKSKVVVDRNLYTGQNPSSSAALARRIIADVSRRGNPDRIPSSDTSDSKSPGQGDIATMPNW